MILIDTIEHASYDYVCIATMGCEPSWAADTHSPACHRENDRERREFYADLADDLAARFLLAGEATPMFGQAADAVTVRFAHADA
jgi:hypothetical protein